MIVVIGERVNATRSTVREAIGARDTETIRAEIARQDKAGAHYIDLNAGTGEGDREQEKVDLRWLIDVALDCTAKKFALDSADPGVLADAAEHLADRRPWMLNSVKYSDERLAAGLKLAGDHNVPIIALVMDEEGIPHESARRIEVAKLIADEAEKANVPMKHLFFDPLVFPVSADISQGMVTLDTLAGIKAAVPGAKTTMGLSNFSHGLQKRAEINRAFLVAAITHGLDSAICDPSRKSVRKGLVLGQLIAGQDKHCRRFGRSVREGLFDTKSSKPKPQGANA